MNDELYHWGKKKKDHKYIIRIKNTVGNTTKYPWRYFYTEEEYQAYLKEKDEDDKGKSTLDNLLSKGQNAVSKLLTIDDKLKDIAEDVIEKGSKAIDKLFKKKDKNTETPQPDKNQLKLPTKNLVKDLLDNISSDLKAEWERVNVIPTKDTIVKKTKEYSKEEDMNVINPGYETGEWAYTHNCSYCTAAYELRQRGYDVEAAPKQTTDDPTTIRENASWYEGAVIKHSSDVKESQNPPPEKPSVLDEILNTKKNKDYQEWRENDSSIFYDDMSEGLKDLEKELVSYGDGARGNLCVTWTEEYIGGNSGHSVVWEIENGEVVIRDCQTNNIYNLDRYTDIIDDFSYIRTDNLELNDEIYKTVRNRRK